MIILLWKSLITFSNCYQSFIYLCLGEKSAYKSCITKINYNTPQVYKTMKYLNFGLSLLTTPISISDGLKSADSTEDKAVIATYKNKHL